MFKVTRKIVKIKNLIKEMEIDFNRARKGKPHSTMQKGSPKRISAQKCWRNIYSENIREGIGMCLKYYK